MTAEEFRTRWTGHVPKVQDVTGEYAVLVPLVERPEGLCLLYEVRADTLGRQPGEVCFPGGRLEPGEDAVSCALRETWEELGIPRTAVEVVAELDWLTHQGGFVLYPVLGIVAPEAGGAAPPRPRRGEGDLLRAGGLAAGPSAGGVCLPAGAPGGGGLPL